MLKSMQETLEYTFQVLNDVYFESALPMPVITIMSSPRSNGHFTVNEVWSANEDRLHEINISAEHLDRPIENICATLCHEMVHYFCNLNQIPDTSQHGRYHNKRFKEEAEKRGLIIAKGKNIGWSITSPSGEFVRLIHEHGIEKPLRINRDGEMMQAIGVNGTSAGGALKKKTSTRKYICVGCGNSFRATKDLNVLCMDCEIPFVKIEK